MKNIREVENGMIKGLYFKLEENNEKHRVIINFFDKVKSDGNNKIDVLYDMILANNSYQEYFDSLFDKLDQSAAEAVKRSTGSK